MMKILRTILAVLVIVYSLAGFFVLPYLVKTQGVALANEKINGKLSVESVKFNPYTFHLTLHNVAIASADRKKLFSFDDFSIYIKPFALFDHTLHVSVLELDSPYMDIIYSKEKKINLLNLLKPTPKEKEKTDSKPMRFVLDSLSVENGTIKYEDFTKNSPYVLSLENFEFHIKNIDTKAEKRGTSTLHFELSDGGNIEITNAIGSISPFKSDGVINIQAVPLYSEWKYFKDILNFEIADGRLKSHVEYHIDLDKIKDFSIDNSSLNISKLRIKPKAKSSDIINIHELNIDGINSLPLQQIAHIANVKISGVDLKAQRVAADKIDWQEYFKIDKTKSDSAKSDANESKKWKFTLDKFVLDNTKISLNDHTMQPPVMTQLENLSLHVNNIDSTEGKWLDYDLRTDLNKATSLGTTGKVQLQPLAQEGEIWIKDLSFKFLNPYIQKYSTPYVMDGVISLGAKESFSKGSGSKEALKFLVENFELNATALSLNDTKVKQNIKFDKMHLHVSDLSSDATQWFKYDTDMKINGTGALAAKGKLLRQPLRQEGELKLSHLGLQFLNPYINPYTYLKIQEGALNIDAKERYDSVLKTPKMSMTGKVGVDKLSLKDVRIDKTLASFNRLEFGYSFDYAPNRLFIDKLLIDSLYSDTVINKDKTINYAQLMKVQSPSTSSASTVNTSKETKKEPFPVKISEVIIKNSSADFADKSLLFPFNTHIHDLNGKVYGISSEANEMSNVDIDGIVDQYGSAKIRGSINAADPKKYTDMRVNFSNLALNNLTAYSATFAGYKIDDGKLFVKLGYKIDDSKLDSTNNIVIKHIKLGDTVQDANVTVWPLRIAVALLEDNDGIIDIDLPVKGDLNNPDFRYGSVIWKVLGNLVTKAVTAPFKLLGSLFGFSADKVEALEFDAGKAILSPPEIEKLDKLAVALEKRSKLSLSVTPTYSMQEDTRMLQRKKLMTIIGQESKDINDIEKRNALYVELLEKIFLKNSTYEKLSALKTKFKEENKDIKKFNEKYAMLLMKEDTVFMPIDGQEVQKLAQLRGQAVVDYMVNKKQIDSSRIVQQSVKEDGDAKDRVVKTKLDIIVK